MYVIYICIPEWKEIFAIPMLFQNIQKRREEKKRDKFLLKSIRNKRFIIDICYIYGPWSFNIAAFDVCLNKFNKRQRVKIPVSTIYCDILWSKFKWQSTLLKIFKSFGAIIKNELDSLSNQIVFDLFVNRSERKVGNKSTMPMNTHKRNSIDKHEKKRQQKTYSISKLIVNSIGLLNTTCLKWK